MKILLVSQHYRPEPLNSSDIAEGLVARGHEVWALVGQPNYPSGIIYPGYDEHRLIEEDIEGVHVVRCPLHPRKTGVVHRVWNYYSFSRSGVKVQQQLPDDFDVVISYQTSPVMMSNPAIAYAERTGAPLLLYCLDIWPECLTAGGIRAGSAVYNHFLKVSRRIYQQADLLAITSPLFEGYLRDVVGVEAGEMVYLPHFANGDFGRCEHVEMPGFDAEKINLTYAGNIGAAQSVDTIVRAAALLKDDPRFAFHILGSGTELENCKALAASLGTENVVFHGRHPVETMPDYYAASDAMILTFGDSVLLGYTLPLKIHTYLAAGKPILCSANGDARRVVEEAGCGFCAASGDAQGLADACIAFANCSDKADLGTRARAYYDDHYTKESFFATLGEALDMLKGTTHGNRN